MTQARVGGKAGVAGQGWDARGGHLINPSDRIQYARLTSKDRAVG